MSKFSEIVEEIRIKQDALFPLDPRQFSGDYVPNTHERLRAIALALLEEIHGMKNPHPVKVAEYQAKRAEILSL